MNNSVQINPVSVTLELTKKCNLNCLMCFAEAQRNNAPEIQYQPLIDALEELKSFNVKYFLLEGGEPFLYTHFSSLISWFNSQSIVPGIATNGTLLTKNNCDLLVENNIFHNVYVSIDSPFENVHNRIRGSQCFSLVMNGLDCLTEHNISFAISTVVMRDNINDLERMFELAVNKGAAFLNLIRFNEEGRGLINRDMLTPGKTFDFSTHLKSFIQAKSGHIAFWGENCIIPIRLKKIPVFPKDYDIRQYLIIRANGDVQIGRASMNFVIGNIYKNSFKEIWNTPQNRFLMEIGKERFSSLYFNEK